MALNTLQWRFMNPPSRWCFQNTLRWWMPFAITKMPSKTGQMRLLLHANVPSSDNTLLRGHVQIWTVNIGYWMEPFLGPYYQEPLDRWLVDPWTTRSSPTRRTSRSSSLMLFTYGANKMQFLAHLKDGWLNNSTHCGLTTKTDFPTTLLQPPSDNSRINFLNVSSTMRINEHPPFEFFAHAYIFPASTRLSVIPLFLRAHRKLRQPAYRWLCNTCGTNLRRAIPGPWDLETSYLQATSCPKARSNMPQDVQLLVFSQHLSSQCWVH